MLLPVVLGIAGILFKCLNRASKDMDISNASKCASIARNYATSFTSTVYTVYKT
jgi:hypothetical protein